MLIGDKTQNKHLFFIKLKLTDIYSSIRNSYL